MPDPALGRLDLPFTMRLVFAGPRLPEGESDLSLTRAIAAFRYYGVAVFSPLVIEYERHLPTLVVPRELAGSRSNTIHGRRTKVVCTDMYAVADSWLGKNCPVCGEYFVVGSLPDSFISFLGADQIDICSPCIAAIWGYSGSETTEYDGIIHYLQTLAEVLERLPPQDIQIHKLFPGMSTDKRVKLLQARENGPSVRRVRDVCGSWLQALVAAGLLEGSVRRTSRGTQCLALDGHVCWSLGEKAIDDRLHSLGIPHSREPCYPEGSSRGDFLVGQTIIEYAGLAGDPEYDRRISLKKLMCARHAIPIVIILPSDLIEYSRLDRKLKNARAISPT